MAGDVGETNDIFFKSGEAAVDQEDKIVVPPRKEPEAIVLSDLLGTISSYQSKATFVAYNQCSGNKMDKVNEILSLV
ncbi:BnaC08g11280D [Brassica napus]|uniref:BnaC08g11280D protein n=1 Tax=Brassica napus TaxID=3708 RepID=A0A078FAN4_BRANA|nr:BnaC08g11280D [Brassica napus]